MLTELLQRKEFPNINIGNIDDYKTGYLPDAKLNVVSGYESVKGPKFRQALELNAAIELERKRLARELHDQIGQELIALTLGFRSLKNELCVTSKLRIQLEDLQEIVGRLNKQVHDIAWELRPLILDDLGLKEALLMLLEKLAERSRTKTNLLGIELSDWNLPKFVEIEVYRIVQEALTNVVKHAGANNVEMTLSKQKDALLIRVIDDGCGFDIATVNQGTKKKCFGLMGIEERVSLLCGELNIATSPGNGTALSICIPVCF